MPLPGAFARAVKDAAIIGQPDIEDDLLFALPNVLGYVQAGERVRIVGRGADRWEKWWTIHRDEDGQEGYVWGPWFEWDTLEIIQVQNGSRCEGGAKMGGLDIQLRGGDGHYVFIWQDLETPLIVGGQGNLQFSWKDRNITVYEVEALEQYGMVWPWGAVDNKERLTIISGDGQSATRGGIWLDAPSCGG
jgi:hypothetical protein